VRAASFLHGSSARGAALIHTDRGAVAAAGPAACRSGTGSGRRAALRGLLEAPVLGLVAPVEEGTGDAVLNDAVGHVPASTWPGQPAGTAVFSAHDVTWFSGVDRLDRGDRIRYVTPCHTYTYRVTRHRVVRAGFPVYDTATPSLVLDTCYPLDALYPTSGRYLVYATLVASARTMRAVPWHRPGQQRLTVPAPPTLARQGLDLSHNDMPLGTLRVTGSPSRAWRQANLPLEAEARALAAYAGLLRSASQHRRAWWADLAPSVPVSAAAGLWRGEVTGYGRRLDVVLRVHGGRMLGAVLTTTLTTSDSVRPGSYRVRVTEAVSGGRLLVSGFAMRPVRSCPVRRGRRSRSRHRATTPGPPAGCQGAAGSWRPGTGPIPNRR
jgi:LPXTG-site transpeptidase (sortase) family protein